MIQPVPLEDIPEDVAVRRGEIVVFCTYCGLLWSQRGVDPLGMLRRGEATALGLRRPGLHFEAIPRGAFEFDARHYIPEP